MEAERASRRNRIAVAATLAVAALLLGLQLLRPPIVGLADNGDFERLTHPAGLAFVSAHPEDRYYGWIQPRFAYVPRSADLSGYRSSEIFLVEAAVRAGRILSKSPFFDIRFLGALHALLLLTAIGALIAACRDLGTAAQVAVAVLLVFFFTDVGYIGPFNSLYSQTASLLFLLAIAGAAALAVRRGSLSGVRFAVFFLAAALFVCAKPQEVVHAPLLSLLGVRLAWPNAPRRRRAAALALAVLLCALAARYYLSAERSIGWITRYNMIFMVLLPDSPRPAADLAEMGLDPSLAKYAGVSAWVAESPAADPEIRARVYASSPRVFLLRHPERLHSVLRDAVKSAWALRPRELGNFAKESGRSAGAQSFGPWSSARAALGGAALLVVLLVGILAAAIATYRRASARGRLAREALTALVVMTAAAFAAAVAGDTHVELIRHLYTFQALCDLVLVAAVAWLVHAGAVHWSTARRESLSTAPASETGRLPRPDAPLLAAVGVAALILTVQLLVPPIVGLANNGDFEKVMGYAGFGYGTETFEEKYFSWIVTKFQLMPPGWYPSGYRTSETLLARIARVAAAPFSRDGLFDLRVLGAVHMLVFLAGLAFLVGATRGLSPPTRWIVAGLLVFFFTDVGYAAVLNSFYSQTASLLFLFVTLGAAALAIRRGVLEGKLLPLYFAGAFLFVGSKPQESLLGPILAVFAVSLAGPRRRPWIRRPVTWLALSLCVFSLWYNRQVPSSFRKIALYDAAFVELLPNSPDPGADLTELGLDPSLLVYAGQSPYLPSSPVFVPAFEEAFYSKFGYRKLIAFYLRHPRRLASVVRRGTEQAFRLRSRALGNYEKALGLPHHAQTRRFAVWSDARLRLIPLAWLCLAVVLGGNLVLALVGYRRASCRGRLARKGLVLLVCLAVVEFLVCDLADSLIGADRHLYVFQAIFDLLLVADAAWLAEFLVRRSPRLSAPAAAA